MGKLHAENILWKPSGGNIVCKKHAESLQEGKLHAENILESFQTKK